MPENTPDLQEREAMPQLRRYDCEDGPAGPGNNGWGPPEMVEYPDGEYVRWEDVKPLLDSERGRWEEAERLVVSVERTCVGAVTKERKRAERAEAELARLRREVNFHIGIEPSNATEAEIRRVVREALPTEGTD